MKIAAKIIMNCLKEKNMKQRRLAVIMGEDVRNLNQQLKRLKDMKVERFIDVLEHLGYRLDVVDNGGITKVCKEYGDKVVETGEPKGLFWYEVNNMFTAIDNTKPELFCKNFCDVSMVSRQ